MDNNNPVEPLQNPGEQSQPSVLDRVFHRAGIAGETQEAATEDNILKTKLLKCINPSCTAKGTDLGENGICANCGFNQETRF